MKTVRLLTLAALGLLALTSMVGAAELPLQTTLTLEAEASEIQQYRAYANDLAASPWPELASLSQLASEIAQAVELGDDEGFVAKNAVMHYRLGKLSGELRLELLRLQLGVECQRPTVTAKNCGGGGGIPPSCTTASDCQAHCGSPFGTSCIAGNCVCD